MKCERGYVGDIVAVNLLSAPQGAEFMMVNGAAIPLATATIPQDIYTDASVTLGSAQFTCVSLSSFGGVAVNTYAYGQTPTGNVSVSLPSPITISGSGTGLLLNLQVSQSASFPAGCNDIPPVTYSITPTFTVNPVAFSSQSTNFANGKIVGLGGEVSTIADGGATFTLALPIVNLTCPCIHPSPLTIKSNSGTAFQGITNSAALAVGALVEVDGSIQPHGSVMASRIAIYDTSALNVMAGPVLFLDTQVPAFYVLGRQQQGQTLGTQPQSLGVYSFSPTTWFQISGQVNNLASLPFIASFNGSNIVAGQNIAVFSQQITDYYGGQYTAATTMTLMPQTINGTVLASQPSGSFVDYTVSLAAYDLFPTLSVQQGQTTLLNHPSQVEVYVDNNTQKLNT